MCVFCVPIIINGFVQLQKNQILNVNSFLIYNLRQCRPLQSSGDGSSAAGALLGVACPKTDLICPYDVYSADGSEF